MLKFLVYFAVIFFIPIQIEAQSGYITYITCDSSVNDHAKRVLLNIFRSDKKVAEMFSDYVICGPTLWKDILDKGLGEKVAGANVEIKVPVVGGNRGNEKSQSLVARLIDDASTFSYLMKFILSESNRSNVVVRKANKEELRYYWSVISFDIREPLFIAEDVNRRILFNLDKDMHLIWIDLIR